MKLALIMLPLCLSLTACGNGLNTGKPNSGVIPKPLDRDGNGSLIYDTENLPMTGSGVTRLITNTDESVALLTVL
ncbi:hypothetical protein ACQ00O_002582 [Escherichia coli]|uniref:hypothetical protein n=1 Tax=Escherichia coli TaxID=562 RepID=UPI000DFFDDB2|nr:hypothetical protein [Escherichia coli]STF63303.1 Uncharacterised protein [Escherichia coli]